MVNRATRSSKGRLSRFVAENRSSPTRAEAVFFDAVRAHFGREPDVFRTNKFKLQYRVGFFIVDCLLTSSATVVEIDGSSHDGREEYDAWREARLKSWGYNVVRFRNEEVLGDVESCLLVALSLPERPLVYRHARRVADLDCSRSSSRFSVGKVTGVRDNSDRVVSLRKGRVSNFHGGMSRPRCPLCNCALSQNWSYCGGCNATLKWLSPI